MASEVSRGEIRTEVRDGVGWITIARPAKRNALTSAMWVALPNAVRALVARGDLRALVLQGAEGTFAAGADLEEVLAATAGRSEALAYCTEVVSALVAVATAPLPTLALIDGVAAGGGAELAIACDVRFIDPASVLSFPFARLGVVPDAFTLRRLQALVGPSAARQTVYAGSSIDAARAHAIGLVDEVTAPGGLAPAARVWTDPLRSGSRSVRSAMKRVFLEAEGDLDVARLVAPMLDSFVSGDVRAAAERFLAKG